jgi:hypothetical protein
LQRLAEASGYDCLNLKRNWFRLGFKTVEITTPALTGGAGCAPAASPAGETEKSRGLVS